MNYYDWKIHKRLSEVNDPNTVYIWPARGNDKTYTQLELYSELMTQNKTVHIIRAEDIYKAREIMTIQLSRYNTFSDPLYDYFRDYNLD